jgi:hypothetical protein
MTRFGKVQPFHHGLVVVTSEGNFLPFTFNLSFHFIYFVQSTFMVHIWLVCRPRMPMTRRRGVQGLRRAVRHSHGRGRQVDAVLRGGYRGLRTTDPL